LTGVKFPNVTDPPLLTVVLTTMLLNVSPSTLQKSRPLCKPLPELKRTARPMPITLQAG